MKIAHKHTTVLLLLLLLLLMLLLVMMMLMMMIVVPVCRLFASCMPIIVQERIRVREFILFACNYEYEE